MRIEHMDEFRVLRRKALDSWWRVEKTAKGHWMFIPPMPGEPVLMSGSPGDGESVFRHYRPKLKKAGLLI
jgi:hypothetical protein